MKILIKKIGFYVLSTILMIYCVVGFRRAVFSFNSGKPVHTDSTRFIIVEKYNIEGLRCHNIMVDKETGVMYVYAVDGMYGRAMSPLLNPDGTPQIYDFAS